MNEHLFYDSGEFIYSELPTLPIDWTEIYDHCCWESCRRLKVGRVDVVTFRHL